MSGHRIRLAAWLIVAAFAAGIGASALSIPVQVTDSLVPLLQAQQAPSWWAAVAASADSGRTYFLSWLLR